MIVMLPHQQTSLICNFMEEFQLVAYNKILSYKYKIITNRDHFCPVTFLLNKPT